MLSAAILPNIIAKSSSADEIANVNFLNDILHVLIH